MSAKILFNATVDTLLCRVTHTILARDPSFRVIVQSGINNKSYTEFLRDHRKFIAACVRVFVFRVWDDQTRDIRVANSHRAVLTESEA